MWRFIKEFLGKVGKVPLCNERADRAPCFLGKCFILCWRCTSIIGSMLLAAGICWLYTGDMYATFEIWMLACAFILMLPTFVDGIMQYAFGIESTNRRRVVLGSITGVGLWLLASCLEGMWELMISGRGR